MILCRITVVTSSSYGGGVRHGAIVRFDSFEIDFHSQEVRKHGIKLKLQPQPYRVLETLVRRSGTVVSRQQLQKTIWGSNTNIDFDRTINKSISRLRHLRGDRAECPRFIETLPKRGFRFLVSVEEQLGTLAILPLQNLSPRTRRGASRLRYPPSR